MTRKLRGILRQPSEETVNNFIIKEVDDNDFEGFPSVQESKHNNIKEDTKDNQIFPSQANWTDLKDFSSGDEESCQKNVIDEIQLSEFCVLWDFLTSCKTPLNPSNRKEQLPVDDLTIAFEEAKIAGTEVENVPSLVEKDKDDTGYPVTAETTSISRRRFFVSTLLSNKSLFEKLSKFKGHQRVHTFKKTINQRVASFVLERALPTLNNKEITTIVILLFSKTNTEAVDLLKKLGMEDTYSIRETQILFNILA